MSELKAQIMKILERERGGASVVPKQIAEELNCGWNEAKDFLKELVREGKATTLARGSRFLIAPVSVHVPLEVVKDVLMHESNIPTKQVEFIICELLARVDMP